MLLIYLTKYLFLSNKVFVFSLLYKFLTRYLFKYYNIGVNLDMILNAGLFTLALSIIFIIFLSDG